MHLKIVQISGSSLAIHWSRSYDLLFTKNSTAPKTRNYITLESINRGVKYRKWNGSCCTSREECRIKWKFAFQDRRRPRNFDSTRHFNCQLRRNACKTKTAPLGIGRVRITFFSYQPVVFYCFAISPAYAPAESWLSLPIVARFLQKSCRMKSGWATKLVAINPASFFFLSPLHLAESKISARQNKNYKRSKKIAGRLRAGNFREPIYGTRKSFFV